MFDNYMINANPTIFYSRLQIFTRPMEYFTEIPM